MAVTTDRFRRAAAPGASARLRSVLAPVGVGSPVALDRLPLRTLGSGDAGIAVWWLGVHGGAGESTLEEIFRGSGAAGHAWPVPELGRPPARVVLVARTSARGLFAAQSAMRQWQEDQLPVAVVGLVLMADAPGRLPRALRDLAGVIGGGVPRVWSFPWVEAWRVGEVPSPANSPKEAGRLLEDLRSASQPARKAGMG